MDERSAVLECLPRDDGEACWQFGVRSDKDNLSVGCNTLRFLLELGDQGKAIQPRGRASECYRRSHLFPRKGHQTCSCQSSFDSDIIHVRILHSE